MAGHGAQAVYGVTPDLSTWGKALGNGFPMSALAGKRELMELGGLATEASGPFLLSTTHGPETTALAAYLAVAQAYRERDVVGDHGTAGHRTGRRRNECRRRPGSGLRLGIGRPSCLIFATKDYLREPSQPFRTLFLQELLDRGVLGQSFVISAAHTDEDIATTVAAVTAALTKYGHALEKRTTDGFLRGRAVAPALREFAAPRRLVDFGEGADAVAQLTVDVVTTSD